MALVVAQIFLVVVAAFGAVIALSKLEREVVDPLADKANEILDKVTNPGVLVLALVGVFLFLRARR